MSKSHWLRAPSCVRKVRPSGYEALPKRYKFYYDILHPVTGIYTRHNYYQNGDSLLPCDRSQASHVEIRELKISREDILVGPDAPYDVTWVEDPRMTDDTWKNEHAWGNTINAQLYGVASVRDIPMMCAGLSDKHRQLSLHQWYHPQLKGCASPSETFGPFTTFTNVVRGPNGMIVIRKCKQDTQNMRKTSECRIASNYLVPLCSNPECTHVPITPRNNAVRPDKKWRDAIELRQRGHHWSDTSMARDGWLHTGDQRVNTRTPDDCRPAVLSAVAHKGSDFLPAHRSVLPVMHSRGQPELPSPPGK